MDGFAALPKQVNDLLTAANAKIAQGKWKDAEGIGTQARAALDADQGTSVAGTKDWGDLDARVVALEQKVQPQIARIAQQEAAKAERVAQEEAAKAERTRETTSGEGSSASRCRREDREAGSCAKLARIFGAGSKLSDLQKGRAVETVRGPIFPVGPQDHRGLERAPRRCSRSGGMCELARPVAHSG